MELSSLSLFTEILIVGLLIAVGISPLLRESFPFMSNLSSWGEWKPWVIVVIVVVYAMGIAGNRLIESGFKATGLDPADHLQKAELVLREHGDPSRDWVERHKTYLK